MTTGSQFALAANQPEHIKVRLFFQTWEPHHVRSQVLISEMRMDAPFIEDVSILVPAKDVRNDISAFAGAFQELQAAGILRPNDRLKSFEIRDEDFRTLAYYRPTAQESSE